MGAKFPSEWKEFLGLLAKHKVKYVIVGAHALAAMGKPRHTGDLDLFVEPTPQNGTRVHAAMQEFGFGSMADPHYFSYSQGGLRGVQMGVAPLRIDVIKDLPGITFDEAWQGRKRVKVDSHFVNIISRAAYLKTKKSSSRTKDQVDAAMLEEDE